MKHLLKSLISFFTDENAGPVRCTLAVLAAGAVAIPASIVILTIFVWA